jgi:hypothetical protein
MSVNARCHLTRLVFRDQPNVRRMTVDHVEHGAKVRRERLHLVEAEHVLATTPGPNISLKTRRQDTLRLEHPQTPSGRANTCKRGRTHNVARTRFPEHMDHKQHVGKIHLAKGTADVVAASTLGRHTTRRVERSHSWNPETVEAPHRDEQPTQRFRGGMRRVECDVRRTSTRLPPHDEARVDQALQGNFRRLPDGSPQRHRPHRATQRKRHENRHTDVRGDSSGGPPTRCW